MATKPVRGAEACTGRYTITMAGSCKGEGAVSVKCFMVNITIWSSGHDLD